MQTVFGAKDVEIYHFMSGWNSGGVRSYRVSGDKLLVQDYGQWIRIDDLEQYCSGFSSAGDIVNQVPHAPFRSYSRDLLSKESQYSDRSQDKEAFLTMKSKPFSLNEDDIAQTSAELMMKEFEDARSGEADGFLDEAEKQMEFDFSPRIDAKSLREVCDAAEEKMRQRGLKSFRFDQALRGGASWNMEPIDRLDPSRGFAVSHRYTLTDPLDSTFYTYHSPFLEDVKNSLPDGAFAEYKGESGPKMIGTKFINGKDVERESDETGCEDMYWYDVTETLLVTSGPLSEGIDPDGEPQLPLGESGADDDFIEVDFPAWALDYMVNAEIGSVSRSEKRQIEAWIQMMGLNGYDVSLASYGQEEYFSSSPEFGLPCDCVTAKIPLKK